VASLITDENGYYDIKLDSGTYVVNVMYSGFHTEVKEIHVTGDETSNAELEEDSSKAELKRKREVINDLSNVRTENIEKVESMSDYSFSHDLDEEPKIPISDRYYGSDISTDFMPKTEIAFDSESDYELYSDGFISKLYEDVQKDAYAYGLTAGEINDFSKWDLWNDLTEGDLMYYQKTWKISPNGRYVVSVMNKNKFAIANAKVKLLDQTGKVIWSARTDNTGKAELWENIQFPLDSLSNTASKILVEYANLKKTIKKPVKFNEGINSVILAADCEPSQLVDIAFVVDATGSMQDEIDYLKLDINKVIYESKKNSPELQMNFGSVFYRDYGEEYITKKQDFTKVLSESAAFIERQNARGGGDQPEALDLALSTAIDSLSWREEARTRIMFLVLDAPCHNNSKIQAKIRRLANKAAEKGIKIIPVTGSGINKSAEYLMRSLSLTTNGTYVFLTDHSGIGNGHIAPSTDDYEMEILNVLLQRVITANLYMPSCTEEVTEVEIFTDLPSDSVVYEVPVDSLNVPVDSLNLNIPVDSVFPDEISWNYYPNPTYGPITIEVSAGVESLYLTDMSGKLLKEIRMDGLDRIQTDISGFPMGTYFLRYPVGKKWLTGKVILMN